MHFDTYLPRSALCAALALAAATAAVHGGSAGAQTFPAKPIRIIVPFAPGGPNDLLARLMSQKLTESWGQQVIVENRAGGGTVIGTEFVAKSPPDGHTLLMVSTSHTTNPTLVKKLPFDTLRDLAPVILVASSANALLAHPSFPARTVKELIVIARARPGQVTFASGGNGTSTHLSGELLAQMAGVKMIHVAYKGAAPVTIALLSGEITWAYTTILSGLPHIQAGRLRAIAVSTERRAPLMPQVPTVAETLPGFSAPTWYGISVAGGTPREIIARINQDLAKTLNTSDVRERLAREGADVIAGSPEDFAAFFRNEIEKWARVIKAAGIKLE